MPSMDKLLQNVCTAHYLSTMTMHSRQDSESAELICHSLAVMEWCDTTGYYTRTVQGCQEVDLCRTYMYDD